MADHYLRQGDDSASLATTLLDAAGDPVDIAGASIFIEVAPVQGGTYLFGGTPTLEQANNDQNGAGDDGTKGDVSFDWPEPVDTSGVFFVNWIVQFAGGAIQTYPNDGAELLTITADTPTTVVDAFATSMDLEERLGVEFTAAEHLRARGLLLKASNLIRAATGQHISLVEGDVYTTRGYAGSRLTLPERPILDITEVLVGDTTIDASGYYFQGDELIRWGASGWPQLGFGSSTDVLAVTYTHGYEEIPGDVVAVCLEMVVRVWANPGAVVSETVGNVQTTFSVQPVNGLLLTEAELSTVNRAIGQEMGSVKLR